jgi:hypothetical protein
LFRPSASLQEGIIQAVVGAHPAPGAILAELYRAFGAGQLYLDPCPMEIEFSGIELATRELTPHAAGAVLRYCSYIEFMHNPPLLKYLHAEKKEPELFIYASLSVLINLQTIPFP